MASFTADRSLIVGVHRSRLPEAHLAVEAAAGRIEDDLTGVVYDLLKPLYERFGGYVLERDLVERELREMKSRGCDKPRLSTKCSIVGTKA